MEQHFKLIPAVSIAVLDASASTIDFRILSTAATSSAPPPEAVAVESDFVIILAALLCALICTVGLVAAARCAWLRRSSAAPAKGLTRKSLNSLPRSNYDSAAHPGLGECAICLAEFAAGDEIRVLPRCSHGFHVECIDTWLRAHSSCPSCRQVLVVATCRKCGDDSISPLPATSNSSFLPF